MCELQALRQQAHGLGVPKLHLGNLDCLRPTRDAELLRRGVGGGQDELRAIQTLGLIVLGRHRKAECAAHITGAGEFLLNLQTGLRTVLNRLDLVLVLKRDDRRSGLRIATRDRLHVVGRGIEALNRLGRQRINVVVLANERRHVRALHDGRLGVELAFVVRIRLHRNEHVGVTGVLGVIRVSTSVGAMRLRHLVHIHLVVAQLREVHLQLAGHRGGLRIVTVILAHGVLERLIGISRLRGRRTVIRHRLDGEREHAILQRGTNQSLGHIDARIGTGGRIGVGKRGSARHLSVDIRHRLLVVVRNRRGQLTGMRAVLDIGHCVGHRGRMAVIADAGLVHVLRRLLVHLEFVRARLGKHQVAHTKGCGTGHGRTIAGDRNLSSNIPNVLARARLLDNDLVFNRFRRGVIRRRQCEIKRIARLPRAPGERLLHPDWRRRRLGHRVGVLERNVSVGVRQLRAVGLPIRDRGGQAPTRPRLVINLLVLHQHVVHRVIVAHATGRRCIGILDLGHPVHVSEVLAAHRIGDLRERGDTAVIVLRRGRGGRAPHRHGDLAGIDAVGKIAELKGATRHGIILHPAECLELERELILHKRICTGLVDIRLLHVEGDGLLIGVIGVRYLGDFVSNLDRAVLMAHAVVGVGLLHLDCRLRQRAVAAILHRHRDAVGSA